MLAPAGEQDGQVLRRNFAAGFPVQDLVYLRDRHDVSRVHRLILSLRVRMSEAERNSALSCRAPDERDSEFSFGAPDEGRPESRNPGISESRREGARPASERASESSW